MYQLFLYLHEIEDKYIRTIFNFHIKKCDEITNNIYNVIKTKIENETFFNNVVDKRFNSCIKKLIYCDINITKHIINQSCYKENPKTNKKLNKINQYFNIHLVSNNPVTCMTKEIFMNDKSSLISYIKTTNKKHKIDYGEIKKTINSHYKSTYYSGRRSDEYVSTEVRKDKQKPWIKSISKKLTLNIENESISTRGKSSILQTIEIIYINRTCIKIFKDSTIHVILSKDKSETTCEHTVNKLFLVYSVLFDFVGYVTGNKIFEKCKLVADSILSAEGFYEKIKLIEKHYNTYGIHNFKIGMFNITYKNPINVVIFPSLLENNIKIKVFKGKKLNIVALSSLKECKTQVEETEKILAFMEARYNELKKIDVVTASVDKLKSLIL